MHKRNGDQVEKVKSLDDTATSTTQRRNHEEIKFLCTAACSCSFLLTAFYLENSENGHIYFYYPASQIKVQQENFKNLLMDNDRLREFSHHVCRKDRSLKTFVVGFSEELPDSDRLGTRTWPPTSQKKWP